MHPKISMAPTHAVFDVNSNVNDELRHRIDIDVRKEVMSVSDKKGNEIVVRASDVRKLIAALDSAETLVSIDIENCEKVTEARGGTNAN